MSIDIHTHAQSHAQHEHGPAEYLHFFSLVEPGDRINPEMGRSRKLRLEIRASNTALATTRGKRKVESAGGTRARIRAGHRLCASHQRERGRAHLKEQGSGRRTSCGRRASAVSPRGGAPSTSTSGVRPSLAAICSHPLIFSSSRHLHAVTMLRATGALYAPWSVLPPRAEPRSSCRGARPSASHVVRKLGCAHRRTPVGKGTP